MLLKETKKETKFKKLLLGIKDNVYSFAIGTAENPMGKSLSAKENAERNWKFEKEVKQMHFFYKVLGRYGNDEHSYLITNCNLKWCKYIFGPDKGDQESFIWGEVDKNRGTVRFQYFEREKGKKFGDVPSIERRYFIEDPEAEDFFTKYGKFKFRIPFFESIDELSKLTDDTLSWNGNYREELDESIHGFDDKTIASLWRFNSKFHSELQEQERLDSIKESVSAHEEWERQYGSVVESIQDKIKKINK